MIDTIDPQPLLETPIRLDPFKSQNRLGSLLFLRMATCNFFLLFVWTVSSHELCVDGGISWPVWRDCTVGEDVFKGKEKKVAVVNKLLWTKLFGCLVLLLELNPPFSERIKNLFKHMTAGLGIQAEGQQIVPVSAIILPKRCLYSCSFSCNLLFLS